jgi:hypothetical protein
MHFVQTVHRELVHKWSLSEVLLTDYAAVDERRFLAAAQLPVSHGYFNDHVAPAGFVDPLLILEAARQAATCGAHLHGEVPESAVFVLSDCWLELAEPTPAWDPNRPVELVVDTSVTEQAAKAGRPRSFSCAMRLSAPTCQAGTAGMAFSCLEADQYRALRRMRRGGEPPTAFGYPNSGNHALADSAPVSPRRVHRVNPANVTICGLTATPRQANAVLDTRAYRNRSMFDHPYDHIPAMVLAEAARQLTLAATGADPAQIQALSARFSAFAELDRPTEVTTEPPDGGRGPATVSVTQQGGTVAEVTVVVR